MTAKNQIIRRPDFAGGGITAEEKLRMDDHASSWISNAMRTDSVDRERLAQAVKDLYRVSGRAEPIVVIVPSPRIMAFAGGFAAAIWQLRKDGRAATHAATHAATRAATHAATAAATHAATRDATHAATHAATRAATHAATRAATDAATRAATDVATDVATHVATDAATRAATRAATHAATHAATDVATDVATYVATDDATYVATDAATRAATHAATDVATDAATRAATHAATYVATDAATRAATHAATHAATDDATDVATYVATDDATRAATGDATRAATHAATDVATDAATRAATHAATYVATDAATRDATHAATAAATHVATYVATHAATRAATHAATAAATGDATHAATDVATDAATRAATGDEAQLFARIAREILGPEHALFGLQCAQLWYNLYQGGNMWSYWDCYLTAARDILGLRLPSHEAYDAWERCAKNGGFRLVHEKFCMVSDFPERLKVDEQNRPHSADGPSHRWRDGWSLYYWHGVKVTEQIVMRPSTLTAQQIANEPNTEVRRVMVERMTPAKYIKEAGAKLVHQDKRGKLWRAERKDDSPLEMIEVIDSTPQPDGIAKTYFLRVKPGCKTATEAVAWSFGKTAKEWKPQVET